MKNLLLVAVALVSGLVNGQQLQQLGDWDYKTTESGAFSAYSPNVVTLEGEELGSYLNIYAGRGTNRINLWLYNAGLPKSSNVTLSVIYNGDKSTFKTLSLKTDADGDIRINDLIDADYLFDNDVKVLYFKYMTIVFKVDVDKMKEVVLKASEVSSAVEDPFAEATNDPFQG